MYSLIITTICAFALIYRPFADALPHVTCTSLPTGTEYQYGGQHHELTELREETHQTHPTPFAEIFERELDITRTYRLNIYTYCSREERLIEVLRPEQTSLCTGLGRLVTETRTVFISTSTIDISTNGTTPTLTGARPTRTGDVVEPNDGGKPSRPSVGSSMGGKIAGGVVGGVLMAGIVYGSIRARQKHLEKKGKNGSEKSGKSGEGVDSESEQAQQPRNSSKEDSKTRAAPVPMLVEPPD